MNINKDKVQMHFSKASQTYSKEASTQYQMAVALNDLICSLQYDNVLEIGCGTGALSDLFIKSHAFNSLLLNDLSESMLEKCYERFSLDKRITFVQADAENLPEIFDSKFSLIMSNACFQWFTDLKQVLVNLKKRLSSNGQLCFSTFTTGNFQEIKECTGIGLEYLSKETIASYLDDAGYSYEMYPYESVVYFESALCMLKSFKATGVTGIGNTVWSKGRLMDFIERYERAYKGENGVFLTWKYLLVKAFPIEQ